MDDLLHTDCKPFTAELFFLKLSVENKLKASHKSFSLKFFLLPAISYRSCTSANLTLENVLSDQPLTFVVIQTQNKKVQSGWASPIRSTSLEKSNSVGKVEARQICSGSKYRVCLSFGIFLSLQKSRVVRA